MKKRIWAALLAVVLMVTLLPTRILAIYETNGKCGENVTWSFDKATGTLTISGTGAMEDYYFCRDVSGFENYPWEWFKSQIKVVYIEEGVTAIGRGAFSYCKALESVDISNVTAQ